MMKEFFNNTGYMRLLTLVVWVLFIGAVSMACEKERGSEGVYVGDETKDTEDRVDTTPPKGNDDDCVDVDGDYICADDDCDDNNAGVYPGAPEDRNNKIDDDCDGETDEVDGPGANLDQDGDGYTPAEGDCRDTGDDAVFINPDAIEDLGEDGQGDEVDNDCDGETDEREDECDCPETAKDPMDMVHALGICQDRFVLAAKMNMSSPYATQGFDTRPRLGNNDCLLAHEGCEMAIISTGPVGQPNPNNATGMGGFSSTALLNVDPLPDYQGEEPTISTKQPSCDRTQLRLQLRAPSNAVGFSFDFVFASAEYDEWINMSYNDTFYAIMEYDNLNGGQTTNISFDTNGNEIEVDTNFFENTSHACDESGSGWAPMAVQKSGSTGWLRTSWNVNPGDEFKLTFSIHDEGDCIFDSIAFLDNWKWHMEPVEPGTEIIDPVPVK